MSSSSDSLGDVSQEKKPKTTIIRDSEGIIEEGSVINNRYQILTTLGEGGLGVIYGAQDTRLHRPVALKFMRPSEAAEEDAEDKFLKEAIRTSQINHPNVITIYDYGHHDGHPFIAMEYMDGYTLREMIPQPGIDRTEFYTIARQIFSGLAAAHDMYLFHGDIQPGNIMILERGEKTDLLVKIFDFGLARVLRPDLKQSIATDNSLLGSLHYMSPERFRGEKIDGRADLYSVGIILYKLFSGTYPWDAEGVHDWIESVIYKKPTPLRYRNPAVPMEIEIPIMTLIAKDPSQRFATAQIARNAFKTALKMT